MGTIRWVISCPICRKLKQVANKAGRRQLPGKIVDDTTVLKRPRRGAKLREEVWQMPDGEVTRFNLAYINHLVCLVDNGRVPGFDKRHGRHRRHFMGQVEPIEFTDYQSLAERFRREVHELWDWEDRRREHEQDD